jgi:hypothetical protein
MFQNFRRDDDIKAPIPFKTFVHCVGANIETELLPASSRGNRRIKTDAVPPKEKLRNVDPKPVTAPDIQHPSSRWSANLNQQVGNRFDASYVFDVVIPCRLAVGPWRLDIT